MCTPKKIYQIDRFAFSIRQALNGTTRNVHDIVPKFGFTRCLPTATMGKNSAHIARPDKRQGEQQWRL
jgi:hypothetical protein